MKGRIKEKPLRSLAKHEETVMESDWETSGGKDSCVCVSVCVLTGKELPGLVRLPKVDRPLQNPKIRTRRVCKLDQHVGNVEKLRKEQRHMIQLPAM